MKVLNRQLAAQLANVRQTHGLANRLILFFVLAGTLPLLLLATVWGVRLFNLGKSEVKIRQESVAAIGKAYIEYYFAEITKQLTLMGSYAGYAEWEEIAQSICLQEEGLYYMLSAVDINGNELGRLTNCQPIPAEQLTQRASEEPFFRARRGETFVGNVSFTQNNLPLATFSLPVTNAQGEAAVMIASIDLGVIWKLLNQLDVGQSGYFYIVDQRGNLIGYRDPQLVRQAINLSALPTVARLRRGAPGVTALQYTGLMGEEVAGTSRVIDRVGWGLVLEQPTSEAFAIQYALRSFFFGFVMLIAFLSALMALPMTRSIVRPIQNLARAVETVGAGDLSMEVDVQSQDELGILAQTFNKMTRQLRELYRDLVNREARFRALIENSSDIIIVFNLTTGATGGIEYISPSVSRILGYQPEELVHRHPREFIHPDDWPVLRPKIFEAIRHPDELLAAEFRFRHQDGGWRTLEAIGRNLEGEPVLGGFIINARDVSDRKQAEAALRQYTQRLELLRQVDQEILAMEITRDLDQRAAIAGAAISRISELIPCQRASVIEFDYVSGYARILAVYSSGRTKTSAGARIPLSRYQIDPRLERGEVVIENDLSQIANLSGFRSGLFQEGIRSVFNVPLLAHNELVGVLNFGAVQTGAFNSEQAEVACELAGILAVAIQQARLSEQIQRQNQELEKRVLERTVQLETKNRELETFAYSVSHDLKAPLRGIDGYSRLLMDEYAGQLDEEAHTFLKNIRQATERMNQLINDLLAYSRLERRSVHIDTIDLNEIVQTALAERSGEIEQRGVTVYVNLPCQTVEAEREALLQAVRNLLDNALKFTAQSPEPRIEIGGRESETSCILWMKDNGIGFDMQYHDRIFEIFQRLNYADDFPGTGIGLALVRKAMQRIGGNAWAESKIGQGSIFYLETPRAGEEGSGIHAH